jgi:hypothetical protein
MPMMPGFSHSKNFHRCLSYAVLSHFLGGLDDGVVDVFSSTGILIRVHIEREYAAKSD